jgi:glycine/D-amino acid oxidase-like deaminating enzyme
MRMPGYDELSLWHDDLSGDVTPRPPLDGDTEADVAIVGAGYSGLWTAYYLKRAAPEMRIVVVEAEIAGFGASGRNGGWCVGMISGIEAYLADPDVRSKGIALQRALFDTVDEVQRVCEREGIDCHYAKGGWLRVATCAAHVNSLREQLEHHRAVGFGEHDFRWLEPADCVGRVRTQVNLGGLYSPHCASIHPLRLIRGLATAVESLGVRVCEGTPATRISNGSIVTPRGRVRADVVVRATEGYTKSLARESRRLAPIHSMMIATEPLSQETWERIGLNERETFGDARRIVIYGQRTRDGRIAFGGRGEYFYNSGVRDWFAADEEAFRRVHRILLSLFPFLADVEITHRWGGALGVPRNWRPSVGVDRQHRLAWVGGYVGEGVAASNLAGRTLADLILERDTALSNLPWVGRDFPLWEPEPLRWLSASAVRRLGDSADGAELAGDRPPRLRRAIFDAFVRM